MTTARDEMLRRVDRALADRPAVPPIIRRYRTADDSPVTDELVELFVERATDYRATVERCASDEVPERLADLLHRRRSERVVAAPGVDVSWSPTAERRALSARELDTVDTAITAAAVAIAETGTIVLDHHQPDQGVRAVSLMPDHHIAVVRRERIVRGVPEAIALLDPTHAQTWISGPSATSDIELERVEGVHGPRRLDILVVEATGSN